MDEKRRSRRDFLQNIAIVLLSLSAVVLIAFSQLYTLSGEDGYVRKLLSPPTQTGEQAAAPGAELDVPVRVAVSGAYGRYGSVTMVTSDETFRPLESLLAEALGSARGYTACEQAEFLAALDSSSVYYDFLSALPLSVLADRMGSAVDSSLTARRLILSDQGSNGVRLYIQDERGICQTCSTAVSRSDLDAAVGRYEQGNAVFAFDLLETEPASRDIDPFSLLLTETPQDLSVLQASDALTDTDALLTALRFNPRTNYRYPESNGAEVVVEGERSLRIQPDGTVLYRSGGEAALTVDAADPNAPTALEAISGTASLLGRLPGTSGAATLYLQSIYQNTTSSVLRFGYQVGGVPIRFSDGTCAAEITLTGSTVSTMSLRFRQYTASGTAPLLLPLRQALAIAARSAGAGLSIGYVDSGASTVSPCWLAD